MKPVEEISGSTDLISINLSGRKFFILLRNFARFPHSRLGLMVRCSNTEDILKYCDKYTAGEVAEFYFDRTWKGFNDILDVYRVGQLHLNSSGTCANRLRQDLTFWNIHEFLLDPCCALRYYPALEAADKEITGQTEQEQKYLERVEEEDFGQGTVGRVRSYLWNLTEYPETSLQARICAFTSMTVVIISTLTFVLSTMPELAEEIDVVLFDNETESGEVVQERWETGIQALRFVDTITMWFFTLEYIVRFTCAPRKWRFFKAPLNVVDLLAILPYFVSFVMEELKDTQVIGRAGKVIRLIRVMRILRVFKLVRHFTGLQSLLSTLQQAYQELGLLMVLVWVIVLTISSLVYFAEKDGVKKWTFLESFWWGLMALTTVGNGDKAPSTHVGKLIGGLCALIGVFILALPVPIVVNSFSSNYKNRVWRNEVLIKKQERSEKTKKEGIATTQFTKEERKGCNGTKTV
jgi:hypothetical protein